MANPNFEQIYGKSVTDVNNGLNNLGVVDEAVLDARLGVQRLLSRLVDRYKALVLLGIKLNTYSAEVSVDNIDINTQRQVFTITIDMAISADSTENEAGIPF